MDIQMPGINGIDAMKEIKKSNSSTVFIVMSAYDKFDYAQEAISLGVLGVYYEAYGEKADSGCPEKSHGDRLTGKGKSGKGSCWSRKSWKQ